MRHPNRLEDIVSGISGFSNWTHADKIRFFAWFIYSKRGRERFSPADIRTCYDELSLEKPRDVNPYLAQMLNRKPREVLRDRRGYALERRVRDQLETKYGERVATVQADKLLLDLPTKIPDMAERSFLNEGLQCFRCKAFRAAIVMTWNLSYDHLCRYILNAPIRLTDFNKQLPKTFPKARISSVNIRDDFTELKESEVLQVCRSANIITNDLLKILKEKLDKRNTAAHPSTVEIAPHTAEEYIIDLITNVVLKLV
jgi:hypothetical protein